MMKKNKIKIVGIFNIFIYLALSVVSLFLATYIFQFAFEMEFLPKQINSFCLEELYPIFSSVPEKISGLFESHKVFLIVLFCMFALLFALSFLCFTYSIKSIAISKLNDYDFLDEKKRIKKYMISFFIIAISFLISAFISIKGFGLNTKIQLLVGSIELLFSMLYLINYVSISSKYVK